MKIPGGGLSSMSALYFVLARSQDQLTWKKDFVCMAVDDESTSDRCPLLGVRR